MKVLVTGAAGFLGRAIVERLGRDHDLTLVDLRASGGPDDGWAAVDVTDLAAMRELARGQAAVVHAAALVRERDDAPIEAFARTTVLGTWTVSEACALEGVPVLVNVSSIAADGMPHPAGRPRRVGDRPCFGPEDRHYAISKHLGEAIVDAYGVAFGLRVLNLRPGVLAGDPANPPPRRPPGREPCWFSHVDPRDVADGVARALASNASGTYHLVAARPDALCDWVPAARDFGYRPIRRWDAA
ncbi:MAG TPA: NAD(P)-dependent oxidoreductase [Solirubrobacteraceae bacterium]